MGMDVWIIASLFLHTAFSQPVPACDVVSECRCEHLQDNTTEVKATCDFLQLDLYKINSLPDSVSVLEITCYDKHLLTLTKNFISRLTQLHSISFTDCHFDDIPSSSFTSPSLHVLRFTSCGFRNTSLHFHTSSLVVLEITGSGLTSFPVIDDLINLAVLNVSNNQLVDYETFGSGCNLKHVDLSGNAFKNFPRLSVCSSSLISLSFKHNAPLKLDNELSELEGLEIVDLNGTVLLGNVGNFDKLENLTQLVLDGSGQKLHFSPEEHTGLTVLHLENFILKADFLTGVGFLSSLTQLHLVKCNISDLPAETFQNLTSLKDLDLSDNYISDLADGVFRGLQHLEHLGLSNNLIKRVDKKAFPTPRLITLNLSGNQLEVLEDGCFGNLTRLFQLNLTANNINSLPTDIFARLTVMENLLLKGNNLKTLPSFKACTKIKNLSLKDNLLTALGSFSFAGLSSLEGISLENNNIQYLAPNTFSGSPLLWYLDLSHNQLTHINKDPLHSTPWGNLDKLTFLRLDYNNLTRLTDSLTHFSNLQRLFLDHNQIDRIQEYMFPGSLQILDLSSNQIRELRTLLGKLVNLRQLNLQFNFPYLRELHPSSFYLQSHHVPTVYIGMNEYQCDCHMMWLKSLTIPGFNLPLVLQRVPNFPDIDKVFCKNDGPSLVSIENYPLSSFVCRYQGDDFECADNCACCLDKEFLPNENCSCLYRCPRGCACARRYAMFNINLIQCRERNLTSIPNRFPLDSTQIDLSGNYIPFVGMDTFRDLKFVETLYLNSSGIKWLEPGCFDDMPRLRALYLDHNRLKSIPSGLFHHLESLEELHLHNNLISFIVSDAFHGLKHGVAVTFHNNQLGDLDILDALNASHITQVTLSNNAWSCACDFIGDFLDFVTLNGDRIVDISDLTCTWPITNSTVESGLDGVKQRVLDFNYSAVCSDKSIMVNSTIIRSLLQEDDRYLSLIISLVFVVVGLVFLMVLVVWKRRFVQVVIYNKLGVRLMAEDDKKDKVYKYDAFVSHSSKDEDFILKQLMPKLEKEKKFKLCVHFRDFPVGEAITDNIANAVETSRRIILVVSCNFIQSEWCKFEFQLAHHEVLTAHADDILVILLDDINVDDVDADLRQLLKTKTYLKYGDPWFWEKLYFAMPDKTVAKDDNEINNVIEQGRGKDVSREDIEIREIDIQT